MKKTFLIIRYEFLQMIKRKGFVIMTLAFPLIFVLIIGIYHLVQGIDTSPAVDEEVTIGYIDEVGVFELHTEQPGEVTLVGYNNQEEATSALMAEEISEYYVIPPDYMSTGLVIRYTMEKELEIPDDTRLAIRNFLLNNLLEGQTSPEIVERVKSPLWLNSVRLDETGEVATDQGGFGSFIVPVLFGFLLVMAIFSSAGYLLQGLGEEKENRVIEILLSSVSTRQLLTGKVIGLGAAGLVQVVIWLIVTVFLVQWVSADIGGILSSLKIPGNLLVLGIVYFILGYLFFAVLMASIGAIGTTARESQQMSMLFIMPVWIPFWILFFLVENPDHVINKALTMIPLTAPVTVFIRLGITDIPTWEIVLSIIILVACIIGGLILAAKAFRVFLLMYGKRPSLREIIRSLYQA